MNPTALTPEQLGGAEVLDVIRIETALSRYPIHRLAMCHLMVRRLKPKPKKA